MYKKTVFISGSNGFIGKNLKEYFNDKYYVLDPSHSELDLLDQESVKSYFHHHTGVDYIVHCANVGGSRKSTDINIIDKNTRMFFNLTNFGVCNKFITLGSGAEYDKRRLLHKIPEIGFGQYIPVDEYGYSKYIISDSIRRNTNILCLRLFGVFGKYEDYEYKFISNAIVKNLLGLPIRINQNAIFDWLYIDDLVRIIDYQLKGLSDIESYTAYNVTPSQSSSLIEIANIINLYSDNPSEIIINNAGYNNEYTGSNERLIDSFYEELTFTPLTQSIPELINYYRSILHTIDINKIKKDEYITKCTSRI